MFGAFRRREALRASCTDKFSKTVGKSNAKAGATAPLSERAAADRALVGKRCRLRLTCLRWAGLASSARTPVPAPQQSELIRAGEAWRLRIAA